MTCPICGATTRPGGSYCWKCGQPLQGSRRRASRRWTKGQKLLVAAVSAALVVVAAVVSLVVILVSTNVTQQEYEQQLRQWLDTHAATLEESQFKWLTDPADWKNLDRWDLQLLSQDNRRLHRALDDLKRVKAPRALKAAHEGLVGGFADLVKAYDLLLKAAEQGDLNLLAEGWALRTRSYERVQTAISGLYTLGKTLEQGQETSTTTQLSSPGPITTTTTSTISPTTVSTSASVSQPPAMSLRSFSGPVRHYANEEYGFEFDYPLLDLNDETGGCEVFEKNSLEMVIEGWACGVCVQFLPYSKLEFPDLPGALVLVQDTSMPGGKNWGTKPEVLLEMMRLNSGEVWQLLPQESPWFDPLLSESSPIVAAVSTRGTELFLQKAGGKVHACAITPTYQYLLYVDEYSFGEPPQDFAEGFLASFYAKGRSAQQLRVATDEQTYLESAASLAKKLSRMLDELSTLFDYAAGSLDEFAPDLVAELNTQWTEACAQWVRTSGLTIAGNSPLTCLDSCLRNAISVLWDYRETYGRFLGLRSSGPDDEEVYSCLDDVRALLNTADLFVENAIHIGKELAPHLEWQ